MGPCCDRNEKDYKNSANKQTLPGKLSGYSNTGGLFLIKEHVPRKQYRKESASFDTVSAQAEQSRIDIPGLKNIIVPKSIDAFKIDQSRPEKSLALEFVYGYRGYDSRQNLKYDAEGNLVYFVAALGVSFNPADYTQKIFGGEWSADKSHEKSQHNNDIFCLAVSEDRKLVATGQAGPEPVIYVWDPKSGKAKMRFSIKEELNCSHIQCLAFSKDSTYLAAVDGGCPQNVRIWNLTTQAAYHFVWKAGNLEILDVRLL